MAKLTVRDLNVQGKRVFVRVDYNVPLEEKDGKMVITDATRIVETLPTLKLLIEKGGKLILVGLFGGEIALSLVSLIQRAITIQASYVGTVAELREVVALARARKLKPIPIEKRPLSEVSHTLEQLKAGTVIGRVVAEI